MIPNIRDNLISSLIWAILAFLFVVLVVHFRKLRASYRILKLDQGPFASLRALGGLITCYCVNPLNPGSIYQIARSHTENMALGKTTPPQGDVIRMPTCGDLYRQHDRIERYLDQVSSDPFRNEPRFQSTVHVQRGFVAPLHLLGGLIAYFDENWNEIIDDFGETITRAGDPLPWRSRQASMFNLWLIWGPSIPLCQCTYWGGHLVLQYGYGDENNSIPLLIPPAKKDEVIKEFYQNAKTRHAPAVQWHVTGILRQHLGTDILSRSQKELQDRLLLEYESHGEVGAPGADARYYTAYVWVMFVICDEKFTPLIDYGRPGFQVEIVREGKKKLVHADWLNLLPFFEHANIAADDTCLFAKHQLARKVLAATREWANGHLTFTYACAFDDSGCKEGLLIPTSGERIKDILKTLLAQEFNDLQARVLLPEEPASRFSACHLTDVIRDYYESVRKAPRAGLHGDDAI